MSVDRRKFLANSGKAIAAGFLLPVTTAFAGNGNPAVQDPAMPQIPGGKKKRILLRSGWQTSNIGDIGHTPGTLRLLEEYLPDAEITLWLAKTNEAVTAMLKKRFPRVMILTGSLASGKDDQPENKEILDAFRNTDFFIYNSGMHFNYGLFNYEWTGLVNHLLACFYVCQSLGKPYGLYGQSFDKFAPPSAYVFAPVLNNASFIYCRDTPSLKYLKEHDIHTPVMEFGPDGCFGIDVLNEQAAATYLQSKGLKENEFLAIVIRSYTPKTEARPDTKDVQSPAVATPEQKALDEVRFEKVNALVTAWVRRTGKKVLLAPEVDKEIKAVKELVYDAQPADVQPFIVHRDTFWNADEALSVYKRARVVVGIEPHSLIMAITVGVPVMHLCPFNFGFKGWMFDDIGLGEWLFDVDKDPADKMVSTMLKIDSHYAEAKTKTAKAMAFVQSKQSEGMKTFETILSKVKTTDQL
jgi:polysaccharide pyruvyl transferase WcaK-like protein